MISPVAIYENAGGTIDTLGKGSGQGDPGDGQEGQGGDCGQVGECRQVVAKFIQLLKFYLVK